MAELKTKLNDGDVTAEEVAATILEALQYVAPEHLYPCTNCGMVPLTRAAARGKMAALTAGAAIVRQELVKD